jgi:hypothetical protein
MSDIHLSANAQTSKQKPSVALYWDFQNVCLNQKKVNSVLDFANSKGHLIYKKVYYNSQCKNQASTKGKLESLGFHCVDVPCPLKNSADNQLKSDWIDDVSNNLSPDIFILVSGDGDFTNSVQLVKKLGKKVIVVAQKGNVKQKLKASSDKFHFVDELPKLVEDNTQHKTTSIQDKIPYHVASEYLIKSSSFY